MKGHRVNVSLKTCLHPSFLPLAVSFVEKSAVAFGLGKNETLQLILQKAIPFVQTAVNPMDDIRARASYRRAVAENLLLRLLETKYD